MFEQKRTYHDCHHGHRGLRHGTGLFRHVNLGVSRLGWHGELTVAAAGSGGGDGAVGSPLHIGPAEICLPVVTDSLWQCVSATSENIKTREHRKTFTRCAILEKKKERKRERGGPEDTRKKVRKKKRRNEPFIEKDLC